MFAMTSAFSWQNSISLCPASFCTPRLNLPFTPGVSSLPPLAFQFPIMKGHFLLGVSWCDYSHSHRARNPGMWSQVGLQKKKSINTNKARGGDGIQLSSFKSWKMMLWKCCIQYVSKFGKLSSGCRTGKGQFSFQSQREVMPKNAQTTTQLHSSHTLIK